MYRDKFKIRIFEIKKELGWWVISFLTERKMEGYRGKITRARLKQNVCWTALRGIPSFRGKRATPEEGGQA